MGKLTTALGIFLLAALVHFPSVWNGFVLDDRVQIVENPDVRSLDNISQVFSEPMYPGNLYRPVVLTSYILNYHYAGLDPFYYHVTNIVAHALVSALLFLFLTFLFSSSRSLLITLLFAFHPITSEVVANISGRAELFAAGFGIVSLLFFFASDYRRLPVLIAWPLGAAAFCVALLSKESALVVPLLYLLCRTYSEERQMLRDAALPLISFAVIVPLYIYYRFEFLGVGFGDIPFVDNPLVDLPLRERAVKAFLLLGKYLTTILFPVTLGGDYSYAQLAPEAIELFTPEWNIAGFAVGIIALLAISYVASLDALAFFAMWFFLAFAVTSNIFIPIGTVFGERLAYLPSVGVAGMIVVFLDKMVSTGKRDALTILISLGLAVLTFQTEQYWKSEQTLYERQRQITPESVKARYNYAITLRNSGFFAEARREFEEALSVYGSYAEAAYGVATVEAHFKNMAEAEKWLQNSYAMNPRFVPTLAMLGRVRMQEGKDKEALGYFQQAFTISPRNEEALLGLFALALRRGDKERAELWQRRLSALRSDDDEFKKLSELLKKLKSSPQPS